MNNPVIDEFYNMVSRFIKSYASQLDCNFTEDKVFEIIDNIPKIISGFQDCSSDEEYRMLAKKSDGTLATIQIEDPKTHYKVFKPITTDEYKNFYYECLMYSLIYYELFFENWTYQIEDYNDGTKSGELTIDEKSLPHLLGIDAKYIGNCDLLERIIGNYNNRQPIEQILLIIGNYEKIKSYEQNNGIEIFNYYKSMQKIKDFLLLGRMFNEYRTTIPNQNQLIILDKDDSNNQLYLVKKSNMNSTMKASIIKIIIQLNENGKFFPRSIQSISDEMQLLDMARSDVWAGIEVNGLSDSEKIELIQKGLIRSKMPFSLSLDTSKSFINPYIFDLGVSASHVKFEELKTFLEMLNQEDVYFQENIHKR